MPVYRRRKGGAWHLCTNCPDWPKDGEDYEEVVTDGEPEEGELDIRCRNYDDAGNCAKR